MWVFEALKHKIQPQNNFFKRTFENILKKIFVSMFVNNISHEFAICKSDVLKNATIFDNLWHIQASKKRHG